MRLHSGVYRHRKRVCTERWFRDKNPLPHRGIKPASAAGRSDALPTELHPHSKALSLVGRHVTSIKKKKQQQYYWSEKLRSLILCLGHTSQWHHAVAWARRVKREVAVDGTNSKDATVIINQSNSANGFKSNVREPSGRQPLSAYAGFFQHLNTILNWRELKFAKFGNSITGIKTVLPPNFKQRSRLKK